MTNNHQLSVFTTLGAAGVPSLGQVNVAEPWTAGSIATTLVLVGAILAWVAWRVRRGGRRSDD